MAGRANGVAVSNASVVIAKQNPCRSKLLISCGDATNVASVIVKDTEDATASNGFPISFGSGILVIDGLAATHRWSAIRLKATDCVVGVIEVFPDDDDAVIPTAVIDADKGAPSEGL